MINKIQALLVVLVLCALTVPAYGSNYYVDKNATGSNNGSSWNNAWESIGDINWNAVQGGDTVYISGGTDSVVYNEILTIGASGTNGNNIVITKGLSAGYNGRVVIDGGNTRNYCVDFGSRQYVTISYLRLKNSTDRVLYMRTSNCIVSHCDIYHSQGIAVCDMRGSNNIIEYCTSDQAPSGSYSGNGDFLQCTTGGGHIFRYNNITLRNENTGDHCDVFQFWAMDSDCYIYGNYYTHADTKTDNAQGTYMTTSNIRLYVYNNVIYFPYAKHGIGINDAGGYTGTVTAYGNTVYGGSGAVESQIWLQNGVNNAIIKNNISVSANSGVTPLYFGVVTSGSTIDYNIFYNGASNVIYNGGSKTWNSWQGSGYDTHSYNQNPSFIAVGSDWTLQNGSVGIDDGVDLGSPYNIDILGVSRPQGSAWDIGAYEMVTGGGGGNNPPNQPVNPNPQNGAINQSITLTLSWSCTDPNGDPLTYDVYFGNTNNPPLVSGNQTGTSYNPGQLNNNTTYYWEIVAKDNQGATTAGPVWNFTTVTGGGGDVTPPEVVSAALLDSVTLRIIFTEPLEQNSAQNINNYSITNNIDVLNSSLSDSEVTLTTTEHLPNVFYTVTVNNVTDLAGNIISPTANTAPYQYIAANELAELQIDSAYAEAWYQNYNPPKAIDGITEPVDPESRWGGALPMPDSIMFDLGQDKMVGQTRFSFYAWNGGRIYTYSVYSSMDGNSWSAVAENISSSSTEWSVLNFNLIECRYIKLVSLTNNQSQWAGLYEAEIWGLDQATAANTLVEEIPTDYKLEQNYPNPFNPTTTIRFSIPSSQHVKINVYNVIGELVKELVNNEYSSGTYSVEFNAADLPSGIYLYRLESQSFNYTRKMILVK